MVNKKSTLLMLSVSLLVSSQLYSAAGEDINTTTQTCGVGNLMNMEGDISCNFTGTVKNSSLNAVGDLVSWPAADSVSETAVGKLSRSTTNKKVMMPGHGKMVRLSMTPTTGDLANEKIEVLFVGFDLNKPLPSGAPSNIASELRAAKDLLPWANSAIKVYRRIAPERQWTEIAMTESSASDPSSLEPASISFKTDGTATIITGEHRDAHTGDTKTTKIVAPLGSLY
jgi:hypothetical protein